MRQGELFPRNSDPQTSHDAAAHDFSKAEAVVLNSIHKTKALGATCDRVTADVPYEWNSVSRRITSLLRRKAIVDTGTTRLGNRGRFQRVVVAKEFAEKHRELYGEKG